MTAKQKLSNATRVQKIKATQREELRNRMKGNEYIRQLDLCMEQLTAEYTKAKGRKTVDPNADLRIRIIKEKIILNVRRLRFVLPELRSIELSDPQGNNPLAALVHALRDSTDKANK